MEQTAFDFDATPEKARRTSTTRERRLARADRLRGWAEGREAKAAAAFDRAGQMADAIPFGQPILAGHYSERRDRNYRDRMARTMTAGVEHARKAESMASRAANIEAAAAAAIYSDDEDAVERLEARLAELEAERDRIKRYNASCRAGEPDWSILTPAEQQRHRRTLEVAGFQCKRGAFPAYHLSNLAGNIKRNRDRLAELRSGR